MTLGRAGWWLLAWSGSALWAQTAPNALPSVAGVYTCVDSKGRKLTSDRPILDCLDREQTVLNPSGTVKKKLPPSLTAQERAEREQKERAEQEERARVADERRREKALLTRYPSRAVHDQEREAALDQVAMVTQAARKRLDELAKQRVTLDLEMEFYKKDPTKAPAFLRRQLEENTNSQAAQRKFMAEQDAEVVRVNARFDDELVRLRQLWAAAGAK